MAATAEPKARPALAKLLLETIQRLRDGRVSEADRRSLDRLHAQALADAGRADEALASYGQLSAAYPRDGAIQEAYAELLSARTDDDSLQTALARWRDLEKKSPPRSPRWFRAKYSVARLHYQMGNPRQAAKMIALLKLLHPELGGEMMKEKFEELETACGQ